MGSIVDRLFFKNTTENDSLNAQSAWEFGAKNIEGQQIKPLKKILTGKKCIMVMNVATK